MKKFRFNLKEGSISMPILKNRNFKSNTINEGDPILVFKDNKNKRWTIWDIFKKKHIGYTDELFLKNCVFYVNEDNRIKVSKSGLKMPHAWIIGEFVSQKAIDLNNKVNYNPFNDFAFRDSFGEEVVMEEVLFFSKDFNVYKK